MGSRTKFTVDPRIGYERGSRTSFSAPKAGAKIEHSGNGSGGVVVFDTERQALVDKMRQAPLAERLKPVHGTKWIRPDDVERNAMTPSYRIHHDWNESAVKPEVENPASQNTVSRGAYGEAEMDRLMHKQYGLDPLGKDGQPVETMAQVSDRIEPGIDRTYHDPATGEYAVAEAKYKSAGLGTALGQDGVTKVKQMGTEWIDGARPGKITTRLEDSVGVEKAAAIRQTGFRRLFFRSQK